MQQLIHKYILENGPISFSKYIEMAMYSKDIGYYMSRNPIGKGSDYITSPEISSIFGEMIAIWLVREWHLIGAPKDVILVELGPGTGIMMLDILNSLKKFEDLYENLSVNMIEISPALKSVQATNLADHIDRISWFEDFDMIPKKKVLLIANEFFDALPVDQFIFLNNRWFENKITRDFQIIPFESNFEYEESPKDGYIIERCNLGKAISKKIINHIKNYGGSAAIIDYGYTKNKYISTIQAVKDHQHCDLFSNIGNADITHEVDFTYLFPSEKIITQRQFLLDNGISTRYEVLSKNMDENKMKMLSRSIERLISPDYMGTMFKCVEICYN